MNTLRREQFDLDQGRTPWRDTVWRDTPGSGSPALLVQVFQQVTLPTRTGMFFACHPVQVLGTEAEGHTGSLTAETGSTVMVYVLGSNPPALGDLLVARFVSHRWVAERMARHQSLVTTIPGCPCTDIPLTIYFHVVHEDPDPGTGSFHSATLTWGPPPPEYLGTPTWVSTQNYFFSTQTFHDPNLGPWRYYFQCGSGFTAYTLTVLFSNYNGIRQITSGMSINWSVGFPGNVCTPVFSLTNAQGSDPISRQNILFYQPKIQTS